MMVLKRLAFALSLLAFTQAAYSQLNFSHEMGVVSGSIQLRSDFGRRNNSQTNFGNSGIGLGIVHYINFTYRANCNCYTANSFFNDHFKLRNEISYNRTELEHLGEWVDANRTSVQAQQLRGHTVTAKNIDIGTQLEFFPLSIRSFQSFGYRLAPYISLGIHLTSYNPKVTTTYDNPDPSAYGNILDQTNFYSGWFDNYTAGVDPYPIGVEGGSAWSTVTSVGVRYKLDRLSDLVLDLRGQYFFSDWIDGLNHNLEYNKSNDWLIWLNVGYIFYF